jgi:hypothetical protein
VRRSGNRVGLALSGQLDAAVRVLSGGAGTLSGDALRQRVSDDDDLRDLIAFAGSEAFVQARRALGFSVKPASTE